MEKYAKRWETNGRALTEAEERKSERKRERKREGERKGGEEKPSLSGLFFLGSSFPPFRVAFRSSVFRSPERFARALRGGG
jgi:hypothetical protein